MLLTETPRAAVERSPGARRAAGLVGALLFLLVTVALSLAVGAKPLALGQVWDGLFHTGAPAYTAVHEMRLPRTLLAGTALGLAGAVMQALTRTPGPNLLPAMCMGAALLVAADWAARHAFPGHRLPVGVVTGLLGGGYLVWLLVTERKTGRI